MARHVTKAPADPWWRLIHAASDAVDLSMRQAVSASINELRLSSLSGVERAMKRGRVTEAVNAVDWKEFQLDLQERLEVRMRKSTLKAARASARRLGMDFDPTDPELLRHVRTKAKNAARLITSESRKSARMALTRMQRVGLSPRQIRDRLRPMLGTTQRQTNSMLVRAAKMREKGLTQTQVRRKLGALGKRYQLHRGRNITRYEGLGASQMGADSQIFRAMEEGRIKNVEKRWVRADADACKICKRLHGQRIGVKRKFVDRKTGKKYWAPPEPHGSCRCGLHYYYEKVSVKRRPRQKPLSPLERMQVLLAPARVGREDGR